MKSSDPRLPELVAYFDALFVSGNDVPTTTTLFAYSSLQIIKEMLAEGLPLDYHVVEAEAVYRRKLAAYGDETRATSPLVALRAKKAAPQVAGISASTGVDGGGEVSRNTGEPLSQTTSSALPAAAAPSGGGEADAESKRMKWLEDQSTLHHRVEILYVVDGYEVQVLHEDGVTEMSPVFHGPTLAAAIDNALSYVEESKK